MKRNGFTLVELLVVFAIIAIMAVIMVGILNPTALVNRGIDAQMKKDMSRIRVAFEEYYNDKECFPKQTDVDLLMTKSNCDQQVFSPWLPKWICNPDGYPYKIVVDQSDCPKWYKIMTNLGNKKDIDIPAGWYVGTKSITGGYTNNEVNYGVSSQNILWNE